MSRRGRWIGLALAGVLAVGSAYAVGVVLPKLQPRAQVASGYMARVACACHFVGKRSLESCLTDKEPGMEQVRVTIDGDAKRVIATVPWVASARATYTPGLGCVLEK